MADFDVVLAEVQKKLQAVQTVLDKHPDIAAEVAQAHADLPHPQVTEAEAQDAARANALRQAAAALDIVVGVAPEVVVTKTEPIVPQVAP